MALSPRPDGFELTDPVPGPVRLVLCALGLGCIALPTWELRAGLWPPTWTSLFVGAILLGAWAVGALLLAAGLLGEARHWRFAGGALHLRRATPWARRTQIVGRADVLRTDVRTIDSDSGPDRFAVVLVLRSGERLEAPSCATREEADALASRMLAALR